MKNLTESTKNSIATITPKLGTGIESYKIEITAEKMWELKRETREFAWMAKHTPQNTEGIARHMAFIFAQLLGMSKEEVFQAPEIQDQEEFWKD